MELDHAAKEWQEKKLGVALTRRAPRLCAMRSGLREYGYRVEVLVIRVADPRRACLRGLTPLFPALAFAGHDRLGMEYLNSLQDLCLQGLVSSSFGIEAPFRF